MANRLTELINSARGRSGIRPTGREGGTEDLKPVPSSNGRLRTLMPSMMAASVFEPLSALASYTTDPVERTLTIESRRSCPASEILLHCDLRGKSASRENADYRRAVIQDVPTLIALPASVVPEPGLLIMKPGFKSNAPNANRAFDATEETPRGPLPARTTV